jgi:hypothetical protein
MDTTINYHFNYYPCRMIITVFLKNIQSSAMLLIITYHINLKQEEVMVKVVSVRRSE